MRGSDSDEVFADLRVIRAGVAASVLMLPVVSLPCILRGRAMAGGTAGRIEGIGGVCFKARDPDALRVWYVEHLGMPQGARYDRVLVAARPGAGAARAYGVVTVAPTTRTTSVPAMPAG